MTREECFAEVIAELKERVRLIERTIKMLEFLQEPPAQPVEQIKGREE